ncbi:uncharacterized protein LOC142563547 [Dermacentor variabilis]|uniref:uncharacterized protein LOC142563547 n=1 Tax=Dermacentor variabilis TaxID=34621 RepID=UPI003F5B6727
MLPQFVLLLCVFFQQHHAHNRASTNRRPQEIGKGLTANVYVLYDSSIKTQVNRQLSSNSIRQKAQSDPPDMFKELFQKVQNDFHQKFVMINFQVNSTAQNDSIGVLFHRMQRSLDASATLEKLIKAMHTQATQLGGIVYYFTMKQLLEESNRGDRIPITVQYKATSKTFCTFSPSAAVVRQNLTSEDITSTLAATSSVLGCPFTLGSIHPVHLQNLQKQFRKCTEKSKN